MNDSPTAKSHIARRPGITARPTAVVTTQPTAIVHGREIDPDMESDRYRFLSPTEQRIATMWRDGEDLVDRQGRTRVPLGNGPISRLVRATYPLQQPKRVATSNVITLPEFQRAYEAVALANVEGFVLNTFLTVSWTVGGVHGASHIHSLHERLFASMRSWVSDVQQTAGMPEFPFAAIWVKEVGKKLGLHSHFLLHVPTSLFHRFREWAHKATRHLLELPKPDPRMAASALRVVHCSGFGNDCVQQWRVLKYLMKGLDADAAMPCVQSHHHFLVAEFAGLKPSDQGTVAGPRFGRSRALGMSAFRKAEARYGRFNFWIEGKDQNDLPYDYRYLSHGELHRQLEQVSI